MPQPRLGRGIMAGAVAGLIGSAVLKLYMLGARSLHEGRWQTQLDGNGPAHRVADLAARKLTGSGLTPRGRVLGGELVHYAFGAVVGGIYGGLAEYAPWTTAGTGALFGSGVFLAADESSMPALGLSNLPWRETPAAQTEHLLAHLAFGVATELSRRAIRGRA